MSLICHDVNAFNMHLFLFLGSMYLSLLLVVAPPTIMGSVAPHDGFADLTAYIQENYLEEWLDIFRKWFHLQHHKLFHSSISLYNAQYNISLNVFLSIIYNLSRIS